MDNRIMRRIIIQDVVRNYNPTNSILLSIDNSACLENAVIMRRNNSLLKRLLFLNIISHFLTKLVLLSCFLLTRRKHPASTKERLVVKLYSKEKN